MTRALALVLSTLFPLICEAQETGSPDHTAMVRPAGDSDLSEFLWTNRIIVVFADTPNDPRFHEQVQWLKDGMEMLLERDVVILTDSDPAARSAVRQKLRPRGFAMVLVGKDGGVKLRKPRPWTVREITRTIDKTPLREQEIRERRGQG